MAVVSTSVGNIYLDQGTTPGQPLAKIKLRNGNVVPMSFKQAQAYSAMVAHPKMGTLSDSVLMSIALTQASMNTPMTAEQMAVVGAKFGIPMEWWITAMKPGGGAGGGANAANEIRSLTAIISDEAAKMGIPMTAEEITYIASVAQKQNWTQAQIVDSITAKINFNTLQSGTIKASIDKFTATSKNYLVPLSTETLNQYASRIAKGETTEEAVMTSIREAAKAANPWLSSYIDQGLSPTDVLSPNRDFIAQQLEINPLEIDLMDSKNMSMFKVTDPDGKERMANQSELTRTVRNDGRWKNTNNAKQLGAEMGSLLARVFGRSAF